MYTPLAKHVFSTIEIYITDSAGRPVPFSSGKVYSGTIMQRGYGVGGLFRRLASGVLPLLPRIGKAVASTALGVVSDKMRGVPLSEALQKRGLEAGKKLLFNRKPAKKEKNS